MNLKQIPRYLLYLVLAGFVIGTVQTAGALALQMMPEWRGGLLDWSVMISSILNLPGTIAIIGSSKYDQADTVTMTYIIGCALFFGAFDALFYAAIGAIARYSFIRIRRRWGGAGRGA